jgi:accessory colonization factor AcfC
MTNLLPTNETIMQRVLRHIHGFGALFLVIAIPLMAQAPTEAVKSGTPVLRVYGPGGPAPAMKELALAFSAKRKVAVEVTAGPTPVWKEKALKDADLIFSGSEYMMTDFVQKDLPGLLKPEAVHTLYLRPSAILVRPGNPKGIRGVRDLVRPGLRVLVVQGAGQLGLWEDVVGRTGNVMLVRAFRKQIALHAANSAEARKAWVADPTLDAWLIWNIWQKASPELADAVPTEPRFTVYRSCGAAVTTRTQEPALAAEFMTFLESAEARPIFTKWGWMSRAVVSRPTQLARTPTARIKP